jgi:hypothetical protein
MTNDQLVFLIAGIAIGVDIVLLVRFARAIRDAHRARRAAKTEAAGQ